MMASFSENCVRHTSLPVLGAGVVFVLHCKTVSLPSWTAVLLGTTVSIPLHSGKRMRLGNHCRLQIGTAR